GAAPYDPAPVFSSPGAKIEELALTAHAGHPFQEQVDVARIVDEVETLAVHDQQWRILVAIKEPRIGIREPREIIGRNRALEIDAAAMHALDQRRYRRLQIDDQIGRGRLRFQMRVDLFIERVFVIGKIETRKERIFVEQKVGDRRPAKKIKLGKAPQLIGALEQERELRRQREARHVIVEAREEWIFVRLLEQCLAVQLDRQLARERR